MFKVCVYSYNNNAALVGAAVLKRGNWEQVERTEENTESIFATCHFIWKPTNLLIAEYNKLDNAIKSRSRDFLQSLNHFENLYGLCTKTGLIRSLRKYYQATKESKQIKYTVYESTPTSYLVSANPHEYEYSLFAARFQEIARHDLSREVLPQKHCAQNLWLVKPADQNQGRGIEVFKNLAEIERFVTTRPPQTFWLIQKYLEKPLLYHGRKFDIRMWAIVTAKNEVFLYKKGYIRTSSETFDLSNTNNYVHLTNNCLQKFNPNYGQHEEGNTLPLEVLDEYFAEAYPEFKPTVESHIMPRIKDLVIDSIMAVKKELNPMNRKNVFEFLGYDFMIDEDMRTWLIEVNTNPYIGAPTEYIQNLLDNMLDDMLKIVVDPLFPPKQVDATRPNDFELLYCENNSLFSNKPVNLRAPFKKNIYPIPELTPPDIAKKVAAFEKVLEDQNKAKIKKKVVPPKPKESTQDNNEDDKNSEEEKKEEKKTVEEVKPKEKPIEKPQGDDRGNKFHEKKFLVPDKNKSKNLKLEKSPGGDAKETEEKPINKNRIYKSPTKEMKDNISSGDKNSMVETTSPTNKNQNNKKPIYERGIKEVNKKEKNEDATKDDKENTKLAPLKPQERENKRINLNRNIKTKNQPEQSQNEQKIEGFQANEDNKSISNGSSEHENVGNGNLESFQKKVSLEKDQGKPKDSLFQKVESLHRDFHLASVYKTNQNSASFINKVREVLEYMGECELLTEKQNQISCQVLTLISQSDASYLLTQQSAIDIFIKMLRSPNVQGTMKSHIIDTFFMVSKTPELRIKLLETTLVSNLGKICLAILNKQQIQEKSKSFLLLVTHCLLALGKIFNRRAFTPEGFSEIQHLRQSFIYQGGILVLWLLIRKVGDHKLKSFVYRNFFDHVLLEDLEKQLILIKEISEAIKTGFQETKEDLFTETSSTLEDSLIKKYSDIALNQSYEDIKKDINTSSKIQYLLESKFGNSLGKGIDKIGNRKLNLTKEESDINTYKEKEYSGLFKKIAQIFSKGQALSQLEEYIDLRKEGIFGFDYEEREKRKLLLMIAGSQRKQEPKNQQVQEEEEMDIGRSLIEDLDKKVEMNLQKYQLEVNCRRNSVESQEEDDDKKRLAKSLLVQKSETIKMRNKLEIKKKELGKIYFKGASDESFEQNLSQVNSFEINTKGINGSDLNDFSMKNDADLTKKNSGEIVNHEKTIKHKVRKNRSGLEASFSQLKGLDKAFLRNEVITWTIEPNKSNQKTFEKNLESEYGFNNRLLPLISPGKSPIQKPNDNIKSPLKQVYRSYLTKELTNVNDFQTYPKTDQIFEMMNSSKIDEIVEVNSSGINYSTSPITKLNQTSKLPAVNSPISLALPKTISLDEKHSKPDESKSVFEKRVQNNFEIITNSEIKPYRFIPYSSK